MSDDSGSFDIASFLNNGLGVLRNLTTPASDAMAYGRPASIQALPLTQQQERNYYDSLNGSGPLNQTDALFGAWKDTLRNFLFAPPNGGAANDPTVAGQVSGTATFLIVGGVILALVLLLRR